MHGTCRSAAQEIAQHQQFQKTANGRVGTGVYFWRENIHAKNLAICWYDHRVRKGDFKPNEGAVMDDNFMRFPPRSAQTSCQIKPSADDQSVSNDRVTEEEKLPKRE